MNAIVLAGGRAGRFGGIEKAFLRLGDETFVARLLRLLAPLVRSVIVVANDPARLAGVTARVVPDEQQGLGPLMGLCSGLRASDEELNFVTAVDAPLLVPALVELLVRAAEGWDAVVPTWTRGLEPLCAVYTRRCIPAIEVSLPKRRIVSFYPLVRVRYLAEPEVREVDPGGLSFLNVNTPADYERLQAAWQSGRGRAA